MTAPVIEPRVEGPMRPFSPVNIDPARRCLPVELWPLPDRQAWAAALEPGDVLEPGGAASSWSANTRLGLCQSYGRFLTWLGRHRPQDLERPLVERVTRPAVKAYVAELQSMNAPYSVVFRVDCLCKAAKAMAPDEDWGWLVRILRRLQRTVTATRGKRSRLVGADELCSLGLALMEEAEARVEPLHSSSAVLFRVGLIIALLAACPLRIADFTAIEIGRHLVRQGDRHRLVLTDSKSGRPLDLPVPDGLQPWLERYLSCYRPFLCDRSAAGLVAAARGARPANHALWINRTGGAFAVGSLSERIELRTKDAFGWAINPHLFRDCAPPPSPTSVRSTCASPSACSATRGCRRRNDTTTTLNPCRPRDSTRSTSKPCVGLGQVRCGEKSPARRNGRE